MHDIKNCKECQEHLKVLRDGAGKLIMDLLLATRGTHLHTYAPAPSIAIEVFEAAAAMFGGVVMLEMESISEQDMSDEDKIACKKGLAKWAVNSSLDTLQAFLPVQIKTASAESEEDMDKAVNYATGLSAKSNGKVH